MITYKQSDPQVIRVFVAGKFAGKIIESKKGFRYFPSRSSVGGEIFPTLQACKNSLEAE